MYVFKVVPFLNPDGVYNGHYRSDTFGSNLNRLYLNPSLEREPTIYAVRKLIRLLPNNSDHHKQHLTNLPSFRYYNFGEDIPENFQPFIGLTSAENSSTSTHSNRGPTVLQRTKCCPIPAPKKKAQAEMKSESSDSDPLSSNYNTSCPSQPDSDLDLPSKLLICESLEGNHDESDDRSAMRVFHDSLIPEIKPVVVMGELAGSDTFNKKVGTVFDAYSFFFNSDFLLHPG